MSDLRQMAVGIAGLLAVFVYYLAAWVKAGRRPPAGAIMPIYEPPHDMSPAAMGYLEHMGLDDRAFAACILNLAAQGYLRIEQDHSRTYWLVRNPKFAETESRLSADEKALAPKLFELDDRFALCDDNRTRLGSAKDAVASALRDSLERVYLVTNMGYLGWGGLLTMATIAGLLFMGGGGTSAVFFMPVFLAAWTVATYGVMHMAFRTWRSLSAGGIGGPARAVFMTLFSIPMLAGEMIALVMLYGLTSGSGFLVIMALLVINVVFYHLLKAPTRAGRQLLDRIEGYKMFLGTVESQRLGTLAPRGKTPEDLERLLPYALALGVEHAWGEQFSRVLAAATGLPEVDKG